MEELGMYTDMEHINNRNCSKCGKYFFNCICNKIDSRHMQYPLTTDASSKIWQEDMIVNKEPYEIVKMVPETEFKTTKKQLDLSFAENKESVRKQIKELTKIYLNDMDLGAKIRELYGE